MDEKKVPMDFVVAKRRYYTSGVPIECCVCVCLYLNLFWKEQNPITPSRTALSDTATMTQMFQIVQALPLAAD